MEPKISVIIPVYKVEPYLRQCLDSVVNQTYKNLEILVIDDGSPDRCGEICDEYAARDSRIRVIHKQNGGLSAAWNDGLSLVTGEWLAFVDSDDWIERDYFEKGWEELSADSPDVLQMIMYFEESAGQSITRSVFPSPFSYKEGSGKNYLMTQSLIVEERVEGKIYGKLAMRAVWAKIYRTAFIKACKLSFDPSLRAGLPNDLLFTFCAFGQAETVKGCSYGGYHYRKTAASGTYRYGPDRPERIYYFLERIHDVRPLYTDSATVVQALKVYACFQIHSLMKSCYFHPENRQSYAQIAAAIKEMRGRPYYHEAIFADYSLYMPWKRKVLMGALRQPFVWPMDIIFCFIIKQLYRMRFCLKRSAEMV